MKLSPRYSTIKLLKVNDGEKHPKHSQKEMKC